MRSLLLQESSDADHLPKGVDGQGLLLRSVRVPVHVARVGLEWIE